MCWVGKPKPCQHCKCKGLYILIVLFVIPFDVLILFFFVLYSVSLHAPSSCIAVDIIPNNLAICDQDCL